MMTFCKKSVHSFLGFANSMENVFITASPPDSHYRSHDVVSGVGGLGFLALSQETQRPANVVESAAVKTGPPKRDPGGIGFIDEVGGGVDGLMSCTESLGFESSDERRVDDEMRSCYEECWRRKPAMAKSKWRSAGERREARKFPPPLPSLNHNGQPSFFLRPVRRDGRLELTEVRIDRPEILRASRQDGRLRLHLIKEEEEQDGFEEEEEEEEEEIQEEMQQNQKNEVEEEEEEEEEEEDVEDEFEVKEEVVAEWRLTAAASVGGEGLRRCHELVQHHHHHHHHHHLHGWSQHCVTSR